MRSRLALAAALALAVTVGGCGQPKQIYVDHAWVRLAAVPHQPAAAYFTLHGGPADATLIGVGCELAIRTEMHQSMSAAGPSTGSGRGMMTMKPLAQLALPAGATVSFAPGGRHVMLYDLDPSVTPGSRVTFKFTFADGLMILEDASVIAAGDPAPTS